MANQGKVLGVFVGPHPAYAKFCESIGAGQLKITSRVQKGQFALVKGLNLMRSVLSIPGGFDVYLTEGCYYYASAARRLGRIGGKIVNVCSSPVFYHMLNGRIGGLERKVLLSLAKDVDGFVHEGKYSEDVLRRLGIRAPGCVAYTYVNRDRYAMLARMRPRLSGKTVTITATNDYRYKGVDVLLRAMQIVEDADPGVSLNLVINKKINPEDFRGLITRGTRITYDVPAALAEASLYVHPSRGDIFPVAPLEAMLAGLPAIVSDETGTKEIVEKVDADYVVPLEPGKIAERILAHFGLSDRKKAALSKKFRDATKPFNEKEQVGLFRKRYNGLIRELR